MKCPPVCCVGGQKAYMMMMMMTVEDIYIYIYIYIYISHVHMDRWIPLIIRTMT